MSTKSKNQFEKLLSTPVKEKWRNSVEFRRLNKDWLELSSDIALKVMDEMDKQGLKGNDLAKLMGVSPQQVSKILKGRENLKLETITKLNNALGVKLITVLDEDELVVKSNMTSLLKMLSKEIVKYKIKLKMNQVSQRGEEIKVSNQPIVEHEFSFAPKYKGTNAGESKYTMAA